MDAGLYPAVYLALVPLLLRTMGFEVFGLWILLNQVVTILQALNLNLGVTAIKTVSFYSAADDQDKVNDTINGLFHITVALLFIALIAGLVPGYFAVKNGWWGLNSATVTNVFLCVVISTIIGGLRYFDQVCQNIFKAKERFKLASILNMINRFGLLFITLGLALLKYSLLIILWGNLVYISCYILVQFILIQKVIPYYKPGKLKDKTEYKSLIRFSIWPWLQTLIIILTFQTDRFWVAMFAGLKEVSSYGLVSTMFNHINIIFTAMALWMMPRIAAMTSRGEDPSALYHKVRGVLFGIIIFSLLLFYLVAPFLFRFWIGADTYNHMKPYIGAFVAFEIVFTHTILPFFYLNAAGKEQVATYLTLLYCAATYICMIGGLYIFMNTVSLVQGMTLSLCFTMPVINAVVQKIMHGTWSLKKTVLEMLPTYAAIVIVYSQNIWVTVLSGLILIGFLWKYYLSNVFQKGLWKQII